MAIISVALEAVNTCAVECPLQVNTFGVDIACVQITICTFINVYAIDIGFVERILSKPALANTCIGPLRVHTFLVLSANVCAYAFVDVFAYDKRRVSAVAVPTFAQRDVQRFLDGTVSLSKGHQ